MPHSEWGERLCFSKILPTPFVVNWNCYRIIIKIANIYWLLTYCWETSKQTNGIPKFKFKLATYWLEDLTQSLNLLLLQFSYLLTANSKNIVLVLPPHKIVIRIRWDNKLYFVTKKHRKMLFWVTLIYTLSNFC